MSFKKKELTQSEINSMTESIFASAAKSKATAEAKKAELDYIMSSFGKPKLMIQ